jgi:acetyl-CoA carboxylase biotin carboxylase subunit
LVREQIRLSAGEPLGMTQDEVQLQGWAIACRIQARDPQQNFMPSPGRVRVRFPNGPETRVDTYIYSGCNVPAAYDPLIAKITVWHRDRALALKRLERALAELSFRGIATNVSWLQQALSHPDVQRGVYSTDTTVDNQVGNDIALRDLAIVTALAFAHRNDNSRPVVPERFTSVWHRVARTLPE